MKRKGKVGGSPIPGTGPPQQLLEQQRMYEQMLKERETSGMPTFELFVKGPNSPSWYPAGALGGDDQSKQLVESYMGGWLSNFAKSAMDRGVAQSIFRDREAFVNKVLGQYPQLKKSKKDLKFGYKVEYPGLKDKRPEATKVTELNEEMTEAPLDKLKNVFSFGGGDK